MGICNRLHAATRRKVEYSPSLKWNKLPGREVYIICTRLEAYVYLSFCASAPGLLLTQGNRPTSQARSLHYLNHNTQNESSALVGSPVVIRWLFRAASPVPSLMTSRHLFILQAGFNHLLLDVDLDWSKRLNYSYPFTTPGPLRSHHPQLLFSAITTESPSCLPQPPLQARCPRAPLPTDLLMTTLSPEKTRRK